MDSTQRLSRARERRPVQLLDFFLGTEAAVGVSCVGAVAPEPDRFDIIPARCADCSPGPEDRLATAAGAGGVDVPIIRLRSSRIVS